MDDGVSNKLNRKRQRAMCKESRVRARLLATAVRHGLRIGSAAVMLLLPSVLLAQGPFGPDVELSELDGSNGFVINGVVTADYSGRSVSNAGDINGDGIDDLIIGAPGASPNGKHSAGESYVVFGGNGELGLADLDGSNGFVLNGVRADDQYKYAVSSVGDTNEDGVDDLIIGARVRPSPATVSMMSVGARW